MRQYQAIWNQIRKYRKAKVLAPGFSHATIIQAVMKERSADIAFRNLLKKHDIRMNLIKKSDPEKGIIEFELKEIQRIKITDL